MPIGLLRTAARRVDGTSANTPGHLKGEDASTDTAIDFGQLDPTPSTGLLPFGADSRQLTATGAHFAADGLCTKEDPCRLGNGFIGRSAGGSSSAGGSCFQGSHCGSCSYGVSQGGSASQGGSTSQGGSSLGGASQGGVVSTGGSWTECGPCNNSSFLMQAVALPALQTTPVGVTDSRSLCTGLPPRSYDLIAANTWHASPASLPAQTSLSSTHETPPLVQSLTPRHGLPVTPTAGTTSYAACQPHSAPAPALQYTPAPTVAATGDDASASTFNRVHAAATTAAAAATNHIGSELCTALRSSHDGQGTSVLRSRVGAVVAQLDRVARSNGAAQPSPSPVSVRQDAGTRPGLRSSASAQELAQPSPGPTYDSQPQIANPERRIKVELLPPGHHDPAPSASPLSGPSSQPAGGRLASSGATTSVSLGGTAVKPVTPVSTSSRPYTRSVGDYRPTDKPSRRASLPAGPAPPGAPAPTSSTGPSSSAAAGLSRPPFNPYCRSTPKAQSSSKLPAVTAPGVSRSSSGGGAAAAPGPVQRLPLSQSTAGGCEALAMVGRQRAEPRRGSSSQEPAARASLHRSVDAGSLTAHAAGLRTAAPSSRSGGGARPGVPLPHPRTNGPEAAAHTSRPSPRQSGPSASGRAKPVRPGVPSPRLKKPAHAPQPDLRRIGHGTTTAATAVAPSLRGPPRRPVHRYSVESICSDHPPSHPSGRSPRCPPTSPPHTGRIFASSPHHDEHSAADTLPLLRSPSCPTPALFSPSAPSVAAQSLCNDDLVPMASPDPSAFGGGAGADAGASGVSLGRRQAAIWRGACQDWPWLGQAPAAQQHPNAANHGNDGDGCQVRQEVSRTATGRDPARQAGTALGVRVWHSVESEDDGEDEDDDFGLPAWAWRSVAVLLSSDASSATAATQDRRPVPARPARPQGVQRQLTLSDALQDPSMVPLRRLSGTPHRRQQAAAAPDSAANAATTEVKPTARATGVVPGVLRPSADGCSTVLFKCQPARERYPSRHPAQQSATEGTTEDTGYSASTGSLHSSDSDEPSVPLPMPADHADQEEHVTARAEMPLLPLSARDMDAMVLESLRLSSNTFGAGSWAAQQALSCGGTVECMMTARTEEHALTARTVTNVLTARTEIDSLAGDAVDMGTAVSAAVSQLPQGMSAWSGNTVCAQLHRVPGARYIDEHSAAPSEHSPSHGGADTSYSDCPHEPTPSSGASAAEEFSRCSAANSTTNEPFMLPCVHASMPPPLPPLPLDFNAPLLDCHLRDMALQPPSEGQPCSSCASASPDLALPPESEEQPCGSCTSASRDDCLMAVMPVPGCGAPFSPPSCTWHRCGQPSSSGPLRRRPSLERLDGKLVAALQALRANTAAPEITAKLQMPSAGLPVSAARRLGRTASLGPPCSSTVLPSIEADRRCFTQPGCDDPLPQQEPARLSSGTDASHDGTVVVELCVVPRKLQAEALMDKDTVQVNAESVADTVQVNAESVANTVQINAESVALESPPKEAGEMPVVPAKAPASSHRRVLELSAAVTLMGAVTAGALGGASTVSSSLSGGLAALGSTAAGLYNALAATAAAAACSFMWGPAACESNTPATAMTFASAVAVAGVAAAAALAAGKVLGRSLPASRADHPALDPQVAEAYNAVLAAPVQLVQLPVSRTPSGLEVGPQPGFPATEPDQGRDWLVPRDAPAAEASRTGAACAGAGDTAVADGRQAVDEDAEHRRRRVRAITSAAAEACAEAVAVMRASGCDSAALRRLARAYGVIAGMQLAAESGASASLPTTAADWSELQLLVRQRLHQHGSLPPPVSAAAMLASSEGATGVQSSTPQEACCAPVQDVSLQNEDEQQPQQQLDLVAASAGQAARVQLQSEAALQAALERLVEVLAALQLVALAAAQDSGEAVSAAAAEEAACLAAEQRRREAVLSIAASQAAVDVATVLNGAAGAEQAVVRLVRSREVLARVCLAVEAAEAAEISRAVHIEEEGLLVLQSERSTCLTAYARATAFASAVASHAAVAQDIAVAALMGSRQAELVTVTAVASVQAQVAASAADLEEAGLQQLAAARNAAAAACFAVEAEAAAGAVRSEAAATDAIEALVAWRELMLARASREAAAEAALACRASSGASDDWAVLAASRQQRLDAVAEAAQACAGVHDRGDVSAGIAVAALCAQRQAVLGLVALTGGRTAGLDRRGGAAAQQAVLQLLRARRLQMVTVAAAASAASAASISAEYAETEACCSLLHERDAVLSVVSEQAGADVITSLWAAAGEDFALDLFMRRRCVVAGVCLAIEAVEAADIGRAVYAEQAALRELSQTRSSHLAAHALEMAASAADSDRALGAASGAVQPLLHRRQEELAGLAADAAAAATATVAYGEEAALEELAGARTVLLTVCFEVEAADAASSVRAHFAESDAFWCLAAQFQQHLLVAVAEGLRGDPTRWHALCFLHVQQQQRSPSTSTTFLASNLALLVIAGARTSRGRRTRPLTPLHERPIPKGMLMVPTEYDGPLPAGARCAGQGLSAQNQDQQTRCCMGGVSVLEPAGKVDSFPLRALDGDGRRECKIDRQWAIFRSGQWGLGGAAMAATEGRATLRQSMVSGAWSFGRLGLRKLGVSVRSFRLRRAKQVKET